MNSSYHDETIGLVHQIDQNKNKKLVFFEIDTKEPELINLILSTYSFFKLDVVYHQTQNGYHFLSPTLVNLETWKEFQTVLKDINVKCSMTTLRIKGNKYPNESSFFYKSETKINTIPSKNIRSVCNLLNKVFQSNLQGELDGDLELVRYRPKIINVI